MKSVGIVPRAMMANKPPHGAPCNNCGVCCYASPCDIGRAVFGKDEGRCPALRSSTDGKHTCGVIDDPSFYTSADVEQARAAAMLLLYAGKGCTGRFNDEPTDWMFELSLRDFDECNREALDAAARLWGIRPRALPF